MQRKGVGDFTVLPSNIKPRPAVKRSTGMGDSEGYNIAYLNICIFSNIEKSMLVIEFEHFRTLGNFAFLAITIKRYCHRQALIERHIPHAHSADGILTGVRTGRDAESWEAGSTYA